MCASAQAHVLSLTARLPLTALRMLVQAQVPRHCHSAQGTPVLQQLRGMAALHSALRHGQSVMSESFGGFSRLLPRPGLVVHTCMQSPAGDCAVVIWQHKRGNADNGDEVTTNVGALACGRSALGAAWHSAQVSTLPYGKFLAGFSQDGRFCVTVFETGTYTETAFLMPRDADAPDLVAQFADTQLHAWLPALPVRGCSGWEADACLSVCNAGGRGIAALQVTRDGNPALLIVQTEPPHARLIPTNDFHKLLWVPKTHSLVLLTSPDPGPLGLLPPEVALVRLDILAQLQDPASLAWVSLPAVLWKSPGH